MIRDYFRLARPRIVALVLFAVTVAAYTAGDKTPPWQAVAHALVGTTLVIAGAIALNQRLELHGDAKMPRTADRPLPSGRLQRRQVTRFGLATSAAGFLYLVLWTPPQLVALAAVSWVIYVWTYTPLKLLTTWQTPVGAVAGAMPMLLGAAAAGAPFSPMSLVLFGILYFWQFPHAMAIAWLYRDQFARAEVKVATVVDPTGRTAGIMAVLGAVLLLPISLIPSLTALAGWQYGVAALLSGLGYTACASAFLHHRNDRTARWLLRASLIYLPLVLAALLM